MGMVGTGSGRYQTIRLDIERPDSGGPHASASLALPPHLFGHLRRAARALETSIDQIAIGAWGLLLAKYGRSSELQFGLLLPTGRADADPVFVRIRLEREEPVGDYLKRVQESCHSAIDIDGSGAHGRPQPQLVFGTRARGPVPATNSALRVVVDWSGQPRATADFDSGRYDRLAVYRLLANLVLALEAVSTSLNRRVAAVEVMTDGESEARLRTFNRPPEPDPAPSACLNQLVEAQAQRTPGATAVLDASGRSLTYERLDSEAEEVACGLSSADVRRGDLVPIYLDRTVDCVAGLLGIMKAGAAYVPIEPSAPAGLVYSLLERTGGAVVLTDLACLPALLEVAPRLSGLRTILWLPGRVDGQPSDELRGRCVDLGLDLQPARTTHGRPRERVAVDATELAYVLFTSGSTGQPKGVAMSHAPVVNLIHWVNGTFDVSPDDRVLEVTPLSFDLSVYSIFGPLVCGGSVYVTALDEVLEPVQLLELLDTAGITFWNSAPAALQQLEPLFTARSPATSSTLRLVFLSGDWVPVSLPDAVRRAFPGCEVVALGGPTETAIWSNYYRVGHVDLAWSSIPYGRPISNVSCHVLDDQGRHVPVGVPGRLFVGGRCLANGYLDDPVTTGCKFVPDPWSSEQGARLFDTGDLVRLRGDGEMELLGRLDHQVKIRGFRVEPAEPEAALASLQGVETAVVIVDRKGDAPKLVAFILPVPGTRREPTAYREELSPLLPDYAIPERIATLDKIPTTANGKIDRAALAMLAERTAGGSPVVHRTDGTPIEAAINEVWAEVLDAREIDPGKSFMENGGNSLAAARAIAKLNVRLSTTVPLRLMLAAPNPEALAEVLAQEQDKDTEAMRS